ncbi:MAG TPA: WecB/TagA/CpsF family glycosyltransferase [Sphingomonas sp.]|nr:WecB/TagA/CpsF family glycosyltransferase [Sphingomonas sp.]
MTTAPRRPYLGLDFDPLSLAQVVAALGERATDAAFAYLVTPNVDHLVRLHGDVAPDRNAVWSAYRGATWCTCDSRIIAKLAGRAGIALPVAAGSDLTAILLDRVVRPGDRIAIVGGSTATVAVLQRKLPAVTILHHAPPMGLRTNAVAMAEAAAFVAGANARFAFLAVGSPQQELLAHAIADRGDATGIGLCIGAAIEFVVGERQRAPRLLQRLSLEWAFRLAAEPRRMWRRYLVTGPRIFLLAYRHRRQRPPEA